MLCNALVSKNTTCKIKGDGMKERYKRRIRAFAEKALESKLDNILKPYLARMPNEVKNIIKQNVADSPLPDEEALGPKEAMGSKLQYFGREIADQLFEDTVEMSRSFIEKSIDEQLERYYKDVVTTDHIIKCYETLENQITQEYEKVKLLSRHNEFDHWRGADVIVTALAKDKEENTKVQLVTRHNRFDHLKDGGALVSVKATYKVTETLDLSAGQRQFLLTSSEGDADSVLTLDNPNPLVWLMIQLRDIGLMVYKYRFYFEIVSTAKQYITENPSVDNDYQAVLLTCLNKAKDMHSGELKPLLDSLRRFKEVCKKQGGEVVEIVHSPSLKHQLIADISKFNIQFIKYSPSSQYQEIIMTYEANQAIHLMARYLRLCDIPFSRPAGPSIEITDEAAREVELLVQQYKLAEYYSLKYELSRVNWIYFSHKVVQLSSTGRSNIGWGLVFELPDKLNDNLLKLLGPYRRVNKKNTYKVHFKTSAEVDKKIDEINEYKKQW